MFLIFEQEKLENLTSLRLFKVFKQLYNSKRKWVFKLFFLMRCPLTSKFFSFASALQKSSRHCTQNNFKKVIKKLLYYLLKDCSDIQILLWPRREHQGPMHFDILNRYDLSNNLLYNNRYCEKKMYNRKDCGPLVVKGEKVRLRLLIGHGRDRSTSKKIINIFFF